MAAKTCAYCAAQFQGLTSARYCSLACATWSRVEKRGADECWPWLGAMAPGGYGVLTFEHQSYRANRVALTLTIGEETELDALHLCHNPPCCNPAHLKWGTHQENMDHKAAAGRANMPHGNSHWKRRIDSTIASAIKEELAAGRRQIDIAIDHGVKRSLVADISTGRTWRDQ